MVKGKVAPLKCLFYVTTQTENNQYTLIKQSTHSFAIGFRFAAAGIRVTIVGNRHWFKAMW